MPAPRGTFLKLQSEPLQGGLIPGATHPSPRRKLHSSARPTTEGSQPGLPLLWALRPCCLCCPHQHPGYTGPPPPSPWDTFLPTHRDLQEAGAGAWGCGRRFCWGGIPGLGERTVGEGASGPGHSPRAEDSALMGQGPSGSPRGPCTPAALPSCPTQPALSGTQLSMQTGAQAPPPTPSWQHPLPSLRPASAPAATQLPLGVVLATSCRELPPGFLGRARLFPSLAGVLRCLCGAWLGPWDI